MHHRHGVGVEQKAEVQLVVANAFVDEAGRADRDGIWFKHVAGADTQDRMATACKCLFDERFYVIKTADDAFIRANVETKELTVEERRRFKFLDPSYPTHVGFLGQGSRFLSVAYLGPGLGSYLYFSFG